MDWTYFVELLELTLNTTIWKRNEGLGNFNGISEVTNRTTSILVTFSTKSMSLFSPRLARTCSTMDIVAETWGGYRKSPHLQEIGELLRKFLSSSRKLGRLQEIFASIGNRQICRKLQSSSKNLRTSSENGWRTQDVVISFDIVVDSII